ncbi:MAG: hypothetical protein HGB12_00245 [Bacteroidetes bacterium]|nr:hypothetical protein [Bacteroidota bacterium]
MATNTAPIQTFDVTKIKENPKYQAFKEAIKNNPEQYKQWLVYSETQNPLTIANGGKEVVDDILSSFTLTPDQLNQMFDPNTLPDQIKTKIDQNPEEAFKTTYNQYTYGKGDYNSKLKIRALNSYAKSKLIEQGKSPDEVLNKNPFVSGLNFIANLVAVPVNYFAKAYAGLYGESDKVKIWGGAGWEDTLKAVDSDPYIKELISKTSKGIPLTPDEKAKIKEFDNNVAPVGLLLNIVADPTIIAGAISKGIGAAAKGSAEMFKISKAFQAFSEPFKMIKDVSHLKRLKATGEIDNTIKTSLSTAKELVGNILNPTRLNQIDGFLKQTRIADVDIPNAVKLLDDVSNVAKSFGKIQESAQIGKANELLKDTLFKIKTVQESKILSGMAKKYDSFKNIIKNSSEKMGLRKVFLSEVPLEAKPVIDKTRRLHAGIETSYAKLNKTLVNHKNSLKTELMKNPKIKQLIVKNENGIKSVDDLIGEMIEKPKFAKNLTDKYGIGTKAISDINKAFDDHLIEEAKFVGKKASPMLSSKASRKEYGKLADQFMNLNKENKFHPDIPSIENNMRKLLAEKTNINNLSGDTVDMLTENVNYLTHVMTPEAKKIYLELDAKSRGKTGEYFRSYISNPSYRQRGLQGSRAEIDKYIIGKKGDKLTPFAQDVMKDAEELKASGDLVGYKDKVDFANKINELGSRLRQSGGRFFDSDVDKLLAVRAARSARTIQQAVFYDEIKQFGFDTGFRDGIKLEKPRVNIAGLSDKYFHPDIARAIERFYDFTGDDRGVKKIFNLMRQFQTFWKSTTLAFPATVLRNILGNIMNSFLVVDNPAKFIDSFKDAVLATKGKSYNIITKSGKNVGIQTVLKEAEQHGIMGTTLVTTDVMREIEKTQNTKGVIEQGLRTAAKTINQAIPFSKMNEAAESYSKLALFIDRVKSGKSYDEAADEVYKVLFDYGDLTSTDQAIKSVAPFWTWTRKNLPLQISNLLSVPSRTIIKMENSFNQNKPSDEHLDKRYMSDLLATAPNIKVGKDKTGKPTFMLLEGLVPFFDISRLIRVGSGVAESGMAGGVSAFIDDTVRDMSPLIKTPLEIVTNRDFQTHRDLEKSKYATTEFLGFEVSPKLKAILNDWRYLNTLNKGINVNKLINNNTGVSSTPDKDMARMLFSWALGSTIPYDVNYSKIVASRDFKSQVESEINDFTGYIKKINNGIMQGQKLNKGNAEYIRGRLKNIFLMINDGFSQAKIEKQDRGKYAMKVYKALRG